MIFTAITTRLQLVYHTVDLKHIVFKYDGHTKKKFDVLFIL